MSRPEGTTVLFAGVPQSSRDIADGVVSRLPLVLGVIAAITFVLLFLLTGSVVLPAKALLLDLLSLAAPFDAMVWVFQDGHLYGLGTAATGFLNVPMLLLLFCIAFGLSRFVHGLRGFLDVTHTRRVVVFGGVSERQRRSDPCWFGEIWACGHGRCFAYGRFLCRPWGFAGDQYAHVGSWAGARCAGGRNLDPDDPGAGIHESYGTFELVGAGCAGTVARSRCELHPGFIRSTSCSATSSSDTPRESVAKAVRQLAGYHFCRKHLVSLVDRQHVDSIARRTHDPTTPKRLPGSPWTWQPLSRS